LSAEQEHDLNALVGAHSTPQKLAERTRIILFAATGLGVDETARRLGIWRKTAGHWRRRWRDAATSSGVAARLTETLRVSSASTLSRPAFRPPLLGKGSGLPVVEDSQQQRPAMRLRTVFMITGIGVHNPPESTVNSRDSVVFACRLIHWRDC
jgi:transposase-like protein